MARPGFVLLTSSLAILILPTVNQTTPIETLRGAIAHERQNGILGVSKPVSQSKSQKQGAPMSSDTEF